MHALPGAQLRLREVYGVADAVATDGGARVDLFQALLSLNLMSVFFQADFLAAFATRIEAKSGWIGALQWLAFDGLREGMQNRLPLTWSGRDAKVANITGWTVTAAQPQGDASMASAILDFWTYDLVAMSAQFKGDVPGLRPHFYERPVLKFGSTLVQLPWIVGLQNNSTAAHPTASTLYPEGFRVERFIEVIETEAVWEEIAAGTSA